MVGVGGDETVALLKVYSFTLKDYYVYSVLKVKVKLLTINWKILLAAGHLGGLMRRVKMMKWKKTKKVTVLGLGNISCSIFQSSSLG